MNQPVEPCKQMAYACICSLSKHTEETPHKCECEGMWKGKANTDSFEVIQLPQRTVIQ